MRRDLAQLTDKTDKNLKEITVWVIYSSGVEEQGKGVEEQDKDYGDFSTTTQGLIEQGGSLCLSVCGPD